MIDGLHAGAVAALQAWRATSARADEERRRTLALLRIGPAALTRAYRPGHVTASTVVMDDDGRVLLCLHGRMGLWMQLGGHIEPGDPTLAAAALREATEESGLAGLRLHPEPIDVDVHAVRCSPGDGGPAGPTYHYDVRFVARCPAGAVERLSAESRALGWFAPDALPEPLAPGVTQQLAPALDRLNRWSAPAPGQM